MVKRNTTRGLFTAMVIIIALAIASQAFAAGAICNRITVKRTINGIESTITLYENGTWFGKGIGNSIVYVDPNTSFNIVLYTSGGTSPYIYRMIGPGWDSGDIESTDYYHFFSPPMDALGNYSSLVDNDMWKSFKIEQKDPPNQPPVAKITATSGGQTVHEDETLYLTVPPGDRVTVQFSALGSFDPEGAPLYYLWFYDPPDDDPDGGPFGFEGQSISLSLAAGTHYVGVVVSEQELIGHPQDSAWVEIVITVTEPGDTISTAVLLGSFNAGTSIEKDEQIGNGLFGNKDVDLNEVVVNEAGELGIHVTTAGSGLDAFLRLFDAAGNELPPYHADFPGQDAALQQYLAPGVYYLGVCNHAGRTFAPRIGNTANPGSTGSYHLTVTLTSTSPPVGDDVPLGPLTLKGDFKETPDGYTATGKILINDILTVVGQVSYNNANNALEVWGTGTVSMENLPIVGTLVLYEGDFEFSGSELLTDVFNQYAGALQVVGMDVHASSITLISNGVEVRGAINLPDLCGGITIDIVDASSALDVSHYLVRYTDNAAGEGYQNTWAVLDPEVILTDLTPGETYRVAVAAVDTDGNIGIDSVPLVVVMGGSATVAPGPGQWDVFALPGQTYTAKVAGTPDDTYTPLSLPTGATIDDTGQFAWDVPAVGGTGWHEILVHVIDTEGITRPERFWLLVDDEAPQWLSTTPQVTSEKSTEIAIDVPALSDVSGVFQYRLERDGLIIGEWQSAVQFIDPGLTPDTGYHYRVQARDASPERHVSGWTMSIKAHTHAVGPPAPRLGEPTSDSVRVFNVAASSNPITTEYALYNVTAQSYVGVDGTASDIPAWQTAIVWENVVIVNLFEDTRYQFQTLARNSRGVMTTPGAMTTIFTARETDPPIVHSVTYTTGNLELEFSEPVTLSLQDITIDDKNGQHIDLTGTTLAYTPGGNIRTLTFQGLLMEGNYTLTLDGSSVQDFSGNLLDGNGDGTPGDNFVGDFLVVYRPPMITIFEPDGIDDTADTSYTITWQDEDPDSNATITLYYDNDNAGQDGTPIPDCDLITEDNEADTCIWDTSHISEGNYYIYAVINDSVNVPVIDYSKGPVTIVRPEINLKHDTTDIPSDIGSYDCGMVQRGSSTTMTFTIENHGTGDFTLDGNPSNLVEISGLHLGDFSVITQPTTPVGPGASAIFEIQFTPKASGTHTAEISIANNDADENPYTFTLTGVGVATGPGPGPGPGPAIPEPTTLLLFGAGLIGVFTFARRRLKKRK